MLLASAPGRDRTVVALYAAATTAVGLLFVLAGRTKGETREVETALAAGEATARD
jgi:ABC-type tungstate transport system substrate-binding protein